jgi:YidC/Oxa1 family membrane protein insertase
LFTRLFVEPLSGLLLTLNDTFARLPLPAALSSYALALVAIAVIVKIATYPLTRAQMRSMRAMQDVQPHLRELQKQYKGDRDTLARKQMELYKEHGVNPFGGCLPLLVQMPILFGLFRATSHLATEIAGERFLWIRDLSRAEPLPWGDPAGFPLLLVLLVASQYGYQKFLTPPTQSGDAQAEAIASATKFMPLMFYTLPAAVLLYYTAFNAVSLIQQLSLNRSLAKLAPVAPAPAQVPADRSGPPAKQERAQNGTNRQRRRRAKKR